MHDVFTPSSVSGGLPVRRRFKKQPGLLCAPSFGVRNGFVADVERPLPPGVAPQRRAPRIPSSFHLRVGEAWVRVAGDVSAGGALVLFGEKLETPEAELMLELADGSARWRARGQVIGIERRGSRYAHHVRFMSASQLAGLDAEIARTLESGNTRLATV